MSIHLVILTVKLPDTPSVAVFNTLTLVIISVVPN